jgi:hypothetical protein
MNTSGNKEQQTLDSTYMIIPPNGHIWIAFITCCALLTCFNCCHGHHQGCLQDYKESEWTVKMHKWTTHCYKACLQLLTEPLNSEDIPPYSTQLHTKHTVHINYVQKYTQFFLIEIEFCQVVVVNSWYAMTMWDVWDRQTYIIHISYTNYSS